MPFSISSPSENVKIDPEFPVSAAGAILRLLRQTVFQVAVDEKTGDLRLGLTSGTEVLVGHDSSHEAWIFRGPGGDGLVALPGGGLAVRGVGNHAG